MKNWGEAIMCAASFYVISFVTFKLIEWFIK